MLDARARYRAAALLWTLNVSMAGAQVTGEASVRLNGVPVIRVTAAGDESAALRAARIERRLRRLVAREQALPAIAVVPGPTGDTRVVQLGDAPLVTVTRADADDHLLTLDDLGAEWAAALNEALQQARAAEGSPGRRFTTEMRGAVTTALWRLADSAARIIPRVLAAVAVLGVFWSLAAGLRWFLRVLFRRLISDLTVENLLKQLVYYLVWGIGILVAADALGFDPEVVVTGLGLTSLALGFALKDIISNFVSGILILGLRPFEIGDEIVVGDTEGSVQRIRLRATEIKTYDGRLVLVPNAELFTSRVTNNTAAPVRRTGVEVPVAYGSDLTRVEAVLLAAAGEVPEVLATPPPSVRLRALGGADMMLELRFWTDSQRADLLATTSAVAYRVVVGFREEGLDLPQPDVRNVWLRHETDG